MIEHACGFACDEHEDWKAQQDARDRPGLDVDAVYAAVRPEFHEQGAGGNDPMPSADQRARAAAERIYARLAEAQQREGAGE